MKTIFLKALATTATCLVLTSAHGQQDPLYNQYLTNPATINPAYAGLHNRLSAAVNYRAQWTNLDDGPRTITASGFSSLYNNMVGGGLVIMQDQVSFIKTTETYAVGTYKISGPAYKLAFGLQTGVVNSRLDYSRLVLDPNAVDDPVFAGFDGRTRLNFGTGAIFVSDRLLAGVSVPRLSRSSLSHDGHGQPAYRRHLYLMGGFIAPIDAETDLKPSFLVRVVEGAPVSYDLGLTWIGNQMFSFGLFTRNLDIFGVLGGVRLRETLQFNYTFELPTNKSLGYQYSTHEISFRLDMAVLPFHEIVHTNF